MPKVTTSEKSDTSPDAVRERTRQYHVPAPSERSATDGTASPLSISADAMSAERDSSTS